VADWTIGLAAGGNRIRASEAAMSLTIFLAFCILGCDFLLYVLFQWIYGEKHRKHARRVAQRKLKGQADSTRTVAGASVISFSPGAMRSRTGYF
jgi:hypothetical protein